MCDDVNSNSADPDIIFSTWQHTPSDFVYWGNGIGITLYDSEVCTAIFISNNGPCPNSAITIRRYVGILISWDPITDKYTKDGTAGSSFDIIPLDVRALYGVSDNSKRVITQSTPSSSSTTTDVSTKGSRLNFTQDLESSLSDMSSPGTYTSGHTHQWGELLRDTLSYDATSDQYDDDAACTDTKRHEEQDMHLAISAYLGSDKFGESISWTFLTKKDRQFYGA